MTVLPSTVEEARALILVGGLTVAGVADYRTREVTDRLWQVLGVLGVAAGVVALWGAGTLPLLLWLLVGAFALEHLFPWDEALGDRSTSFIGVVELLVYAVVIGVVAISVDRWGLGRSTVPVGVVAAVVSVVLARGLFELGVLYGGADAKALIVVGVVLPLFGAPLLYSPSVDATLLSLLPFSVTLLTDAAVVSIVVPLAIAARNLVRGEFTLRRGFTSYTLPVEELPRRFVWVRDPALGEDTMVDDAETSEEDTRRRAALAESLARKGTRRVWVTPQLPFLVVMAVGAGVGLLAGNLLLDLFALL